MTNTKTVLILHGWPQPVAPGTANYQFYEYFKNKGYNVVAPQLFTSNFVLKEPDAKNYIEQLLNGVKPDVIVGISLGGLLAPQIAKDYPDAKLIFIASDPKMQPEAPGFKVVLFLARNKNLLRLLNFIKFLPEKVLFGFYELIDPFRGSPADRKLYLDDMRQNFKYMIAIPVDEEKEIISFVTSTDNTQLLGTLKNQSLIFSGKNDLMMPANSEVNLQTLLTNSQLIESNGGHFEVFTQDNFKDIDKFLSE